MKTWPTIMLIGALGTILPMYAYIFNLIDSSALILIGVPCLFLFLTAIVNCDEYTRKLK